MLYSLSLEYCMLTLEKTLGHGSQASKDIHREPQLALANF